MKIINIPKIEDWVKDFECFRCKTNLHADYNDLQYKLERKCSGAYGDTGSSWTEDSYYLICAICEQPYPISENNISFLLKKHVKEKFKK